MKTIAEVVEALNTVSEFCNQYNRCIDGCPLYIAGYECCLRLREPREHNVKVYDPHEICVPLFEEKG